MQAISRNKIGRAVDSQNSRDPCGVVEESYEGAGNEHPALYTNQHGRIRAGELARRNHFLHERVHGGPIHCRTRPGDQRHAVEVPELQPPTPGDIRGQQDEKPPHQVQHDAEIAPVDAVDQHAAKEGHEESRQGHHNDLPADFDRRVRGREDVPAHAGKIHAAAEERHKHGHKKITEPALRPDQVPVDSMCACRRGHGCKVKTLF